MFSENIYSENTNSQTNIDRNDSIVTNAIIEVEYIKSDSSGINWKNALEEARILQTLDKKGIRITLPNNDTAKVLITNKKGNKILKKINYVAPAVIDVSKLHRKTYQLIIEMHDTVVVKKFERKRK
jgi:hypothetical protein